MPKRDARPARTGRVFVMREVPMTTLPCTACATTLEAHCPSPTCHWMRCPKAGCEWSTYDLERGIRVSNRADRVERLGAPPEVEG